MPGQQRCVVAAVKLLPACLCACLPARVPACLRACLPARVHACLPARLPACPPHLRISLLPAPCCGCRAVCTEAVPSDPNALPSACCTPRFHASHAHCCVPPLVPFSIQAGPSACRTCCQTWTRCWSGRCSAGTSDVGLHAGRCCCDGAAAAPAACHMVGRVRRCSLCTLRCPPCARCAASLCTLRCLPLHTALPALEAQQRWRGSGADRSRVPPRKNAAGRRQVSSPFSFSVSTGCTLSTHPHFGLAALATHIQTLLFNLASTAESLLPSFLPLFTFLSSLRWRFQCQAHTHVSHPRDGQLRRAQEQQQHSGCRYKLDGTEEGAPPHTPTEPENTSSAGPVM